MIKAASCLSHFGEEPFLSGTKGAGAVFFSGCNLHCSYCQNFQISQQSIGKIFPEEELADELLKLQDKGCHNIDLISPSHLINGIVKTLEIAKENGLKIPIIYNSNGYDTVDALKKIEGLIDIYLPDIKYSNNKIAFELSGIPGYVEVNRAAISEMFRQKGNILLDNEGIAEKGVLVRHLVLPNDLAGSCDSLDFLSGLSLDLWLSIMSQYTPCYKAADNQLLNRKITVEEYEKVLTFAEDLGFHNIFTQEMDSADNYLPDFMKDLPFDN